jgi:hypothetical protein
MALNWGSFITDEALGLSTSGDQWTGSSADQSLRSTSSRKTSTSSISSFDRSRSQSNVPSHANSIVSYPTTQLTNPQLSNAFIIPDQFFMGDLNASDPFEDAIGGTSTSESPEPILDFGVNDDLAYPYQKPSVGKLRNQDPTMPTSATTRHSDSSASPESALLQDPSGFPLQGLEDLNFDTSSLEDSDLFSTKRMRSNPDQISACWESPLCPNKPKPGEDHPSPSTCGGACAPFLFDSNAPDPLATDVESMASVQAALQPAPGLVQIQKSRNKRVDSGSHENARSYDRGFSANQRDPIIKPDPARDPARDAGLSTIEEDRSSAQSSSKAAKPPPPTGGGQRRRLPHNQVERKYRESLNTQLESLRRVIPALQQPIPSSAVGDDSLCPGDKADIEDLPSLAPSKPSKAVVLASATAYIKQLEKEKKALAEENAALNGRLKAYGVRTQVRCDDCSLMQYVKGLKIHTPA